MNLMEKLKITSAQNPLIKKIALCATSTKARSNASYTLLDGIHLCQELLKNNGTFIYLFVSESFLKHSEFIKFKDQKGLIILADSLMKKISPSKTPIGILGIMQSPAPKIMPEKIESHFILLLENIQDPGNMGTILRTAAACGVTIGMDLRDS